MRGFYCACGMFVPFGSSVEKQIKHMNGSYHNERLKENKGLKHSKTGHPYVMRKIIGIKFKDHYGYMVNLECGHVSYLHNGASTSMKLFMLTEPDLKDKSITGCQHCGHELEVKKIEEISMQKNPESERLIDRIMALMKERGHLTAEEASDYLKMPKQNCLQVLRKLFTNWNAIERRVEKQNGKNVPVYYLKN
jgi:hypothetical protein